MPLQKIYLPLPPRTKGSAPAELPQGRNAARVGG